VSEDVIGRLGDSVVFAEWIFHGLTGLALLRLRRRSPDLPRPFRSPLYPLFPLAYALMAAGVVFGNLRTSEWEVTGLGLAVLAVGTIVYLPWRRMFAGETVRADGDQA
jgi:APA family basic amino acid/polyamine antiporter